MKKLMKVLALIVCFMLLNTVAFGEETFTFRNGITWGMTADEVKAQEGTEVYNEENIGGIHVLSYNHADVGGYDGVVGYVFIDEKLVLSMYTVELYDGKIDPASAKAEMDEKYTASEQVNIRPFMKASMSMMVEAGEEDIIAEFDEVINGMDDEMLEAYMAELGTIYEYSAPGTGIWLVSDDSGMLMIAYADETWLNP